MFANLHTLPADRHMFTLYVTDSPVGTPAGKMFVDEVDVIAPTYSSVDDIVRAADLYGYEGGRIIGVTDESDGVVLYENTEQGIPVP